jgi:hypothetical protein
MTNWGIGQVTKVDLPYITVYFEAVGEKKLRADLVELRKADGDDAESSILDKKFKAKRTGKRRKFDDPMYFNEGKGTSRKKFIESLGATCSNWYWSWSFVNEDEKKIFFGAWRDLTEGNRALIFSNDWRTKHGKNRPSWPESRENIRMIEEEGYSLHVYTMIMDPDSEPEYELGPRRIGAILNDVTQAELVRDGDNWYAVFHEKPAVT